MTAPVCDVTYVSIPFSANLSIVSGAGWPYSLSIPQLITAVSGVNASIRSKELEYLLP